MTMSISSSVISLPLRMPLSLMTFFPVGASLVRTDKDGKQTNLPGDSLEISEKVGQGWIACKKGINRI